MENTSHLIRLLRKNAGLTQKELAEMINVSEKTVSKWETAKGLPDVNILPSLSKALGTTVDSLLNGRAEIKPAMKRTSFYVCGICGNILTSASECEIFCHGTRLAPLKAVHPDEENMISTEINDGEILVTSSHPMTKEHHISFVAFVSYDGVNIKNTYPEWPVNVRFPYKRGEIIYYCTTHGLFSQKIK